MKSLVRTSLGEADEPFLRGTNFLCRKRMLGLGEKGEWLVGDAAGAFRCQDPDGMTFRKGRSESCGDSRH